MASETLKEVIDDTVVEGIAFENQVRSLFWGAPWQFGLSSIRCQGQKQACFETKCLCESGKLSIETGKNQVGCIGEVELRKLRNITHQKVFSDFSLSVLRRQERS